MKRAIIVGKNYRSRGGNPIRIYSVTAGGQCPVHGAYQDKGGHWTGISWNSEGKFNPFKGDPSDLDIMREDDTVLIDAYRRQYLEALQDIEKYISKERAFLYDMTALRERVSRALLPITDSFSNGEQSE